MMTQILENGQIITLIHWVRPVATGGWRIVCMPGLAFFDRSPGHPGYLRSDDLAAVNCPVCRRRANGAGA